MLVVGLAIRIWSAQYLYLLPFGLLLSLWKTLFSLTEIFGVGTDHFISSSVLNEFVIALDIIVVTFYFAYMGILYWKYALSKIRMFTLFVKGEEVTIWTKSQ